MAEPPMPPTVSDPAEPKSDPLAAVVSRAVAELRRTAGLSERAAAKLLKTSQTQLRRMEDARYLPSLRSLVRLAAAYGQRVVVTFEPLHPKPTKTARTPAPRVRSSTPRTRPRRAARRRG